MARATPFNSLRHPQQHEEISEFIRDEIFSNRLKTGQSLPSEAELCAQFNSSRGPVRQAMSTLRAEGLISSGRGRRSIVLSNARTETFDDILSNSSWLMRVGKKVTSRMLYFEPRPIPAEAAEGLSAQPGAPLLTLKRVRSANDEPLLIETLYFDESVLDIMRTIDVEHESVHLHLMRNGIDFNNISRCFEFEQADEQDAALLEVPEGTALIVARIRAYTHAGKAVEYAVHKFRADKVSIGLNNVRGQASPLWFEVDSNIH